MAAGLASGHAIKNVEMHGAHPRQHGLDLVYPSSYASSLAGIMINDAAIPTHYATTGSAGADAAQRTLLDNLETETIHITRTFVTETERHMMLHSIVFVQAQRVQRAEGYLSATLIGAA